MPKISRCLPANGDVMVVYSTGKLWNRLRIPKARFHMSVTVILNPPWVSRVALVVNVHLDPTVPIAAAVQPRQVILTDGNDYGERTIGRRSSRHPTCPSRWELLPANVSRAAERDVSRVRSGQICHQDRWPGEGARRRAPNVRRRATRSTRGAPTYVCLRTGGGRRESVCSRSTYVSRY